MPNIVAVAPPSLSPSGSYTIPLGYHNGSGIISGKENTEIFVPNTRSTSIDMGETNTYRYVNTSGIPNSNNGTFTANSRNASLDMGETNTYRYVNTSSIPNDNSGTYTFSSGDTGGTKDLGATNTYRYVNASNVYNKGIEVGQNDKRYLYLQVLNTSGGWWITYQAIYHKTGLDKITHIQPNAQYGYTVTISDNIVIKRLDSSNDIDITIPFKCKVYGADEETYNQQSSTNPNTIHNNYGYKKIINANETYHFTAADSIVIFREI